MIVAVEKLLPDVKYEFQVQAVSKPGVSVPSDVCFASTERGLRPADRLIEKSMLIHKGNPAIYQLPVKTVRGNDSHGVFKKAIGNPKASTKPERVLMLVGATGAGKTTLINGTFSESSGQMIFDSSLSQMKAKCLRFIVKPRI